MNGMRGMKRGTALHAVMPLYRYALGRYAVGALVFGLAACTAPSRAPQPTAAVPVVTRPVTFAPGSARYRRASSRQIEQQQAGGQAQRIEEALVYFISATLTRQGDRMAVSFTVDSVPRYQSDGPALGLAERARGATFAGRLETDGEITGLSGGDSSSKLLQQLADELPGMYPRIPPTGVKPLDRWVDTTHTTSKTGGLPLAVVAVSQHEAEPPADSGAARALRIRTLTTYSFSGSASQGGQAYSVLGQGRRHAVRRLSLDGRLLGMVSADTSSYTISLLGLDVSIPGRQTRADTLSIIP
jgi:hypothetical protein